MNYGLSIADMCEECGHLDVYTSTAIQEVIEYKWKKFARRWHMIGCSFHFFYMSILIIYNNFVYFENEIENLPEHLGEEKG